MGKLRTRRWDPVRHLRDEEDMVAYLQAALEDGTPGLVTAVLGDIARAKGMTAVARKAGLGRESLYKALSPEGNPEFATVLRVVEALGLRFEVAEASRENAVTAPRTAAAARSAGTPRAPASRSRSSR